MKQKERRKSAAGSNVTKKCSVFEVLFQLKPEFMKLGLLLMLEEQVFGHMLDIYNLEGSFNLDITL